MTERDFNPAQMSVPIQPRRLNDMPIRDELRRIIEEVLQRDEKAMDEITRLGVLEFVRRHGGEIRLTKVSNQSKEPRIRNYEEQDLTALVKIVNENHMDYPDFFYEFIAYTTDSLRSKIESRPVVFVAGNERLEGFISCYIALWGTTIDTLCVKRGPNRTRIEDMLISKVEEGAKGWKVVVFLGSDSQRIIDFEKKGYEVYGGLYHFSRNLEEVPSIPPLPDGANLRNMTKGEEEAITEAFYNPESVGTSIFKPGFTRVWKENWNHVAEMKGKTIAIICSRPEKKFNKYYNAKRAEIWGPVTLPEYQWKGFEKALMCRVLNSLREKGMEEASIVDTETPSEHVDFKLNLGFKVRKHWKFLRKYH